jgi:hypothetical protein
MYFICPLEFQEGCIQHGHSSTQTNKDSISRHASIIHVAWEEGVALTNSIGKHVSLQADMSLANINNMTTLDLGKTDKCNSVTGW